VDTLFVFVIATDVEVSDLAFCVDEPLLPLDSAITGAAATGACGSSFLPQAATDKHAKTSHKRRLFMMAETP
jgi:hypothetical protein